jgi:hypothetical protein
MPEPIYFLIVRENEQELAEGVRVAILTGAERLGPLIADPDGYVIQLMKAPWNPERI